MRDALVKAAEQQLAEQAPLIIRPREISRSLGVQRREAEVLLRRLARESSRLDVVPRGQMFVVTQGDA